MIIWLKIILAGVSSKYNDQLLHQVANLRNNSFKPLLCRDKAQSIPALML
jgi:hypothetical protein